MFIDDFYVVRKVSEGQRGGAGEEGKRGGGGEGGREEEEEGKGGNKGCYSHTCDPHTDTNCVVTEGGNIKPKELAELPHIPKSAAWSNDSQSRSRVVLVGGFHTMKSLV